MDRRRSKILLTIHLAVLTALVGCFPAPRQAAAPAPADEYSRARARYVKNRMTPPAQYALAPVPPRNNDFGEFDDAFYTGLDQQPALPPLPGDSLGGISAMTPANMPSAAAAVPPPQGMRNMQGITTANNTFFPVEQLVYGGDDGAAPDSPDAYRLMPRDTISVTVRNHPEFSGRLTLQADGSVRVPNTPDLVHLRGMTAPEAADELRRTLAVYVKGDCVVRVQANRARGGHYFVFGDVRQPGRFPMGMEDVRLSDAVMAANFETNPNRLPADEELSPAFPASSPPGASLPPRTADMARVMLITPHRSQPARTTHDLRRALLGSTADNPVVRPGQIIVVPSLDPEKNAAIGLDMPDMTQPPPALREDQGFSTANSPARLPEVTPYAAVDLAAMRAPRPLTDVEENLRRAYETQANEEAATIERFPAAEEYAGEYVEEYYEEYPAGTIISVESVDPVLPEIGTVVDGYEYAAGAPAATVRGRRLRKAPFATVTESVVEIEASPSSPPRGTVDGWKKGF